MNNNKLEVGDLLIYHKDTIFMFIEYITRVDSDSYDSLLFNNENEMLKIEMYKLYNTKLDISQGRAYIKKKKCDIVNI